MLFEEPLPTPISTQSDRGAIYLRLNNYLDITSSLCCNWDVKIMNTKTSGEDAYAALKKSKALKSSILIEDGPCEKASTYIAINS